MLVGSREGKLHETDLQTGTVLRTQTVGTGGAIVGSPSYDTVAQELIVGSSDGKLYPYGLPL